MNQTHIHLLITHVPIFGSILGGFVLAWGIFYNSKHTKMAAYYIFIMSAVGASIAYFTGEAAEETIENIQGISASIIEQHEDFAIYALVSLIILGFTAVIGLLLSNRDHDTTKKMAFFTLLLSLISFGLVARTGYLGGQIRHTELNAVSSINYQNENINQQHQKSDNND